MGYTTVFDAAIPPLAARHAHEEFGDTPIIDKGFFLLFGNNHYVLNQIAANDFRGEARTWEAMRQHMLVIADSIADALAKQFPTHFSRTST